MTSRIVSFALALTMAACGTPAVHPGTGIQGTVQAGPPRPPGRINSPCPPPPLAATGGGGGASGGEGARFYSGGDGRLKLGPRPRPQHPVGANNRPRLPPPARP